MIGLALGILGAIALGAVVLGLVVALGGLGRYLHTRSQVEQEANKGRAEELRHRRKLNAIAHERQVDELLQGRALAAGPPQGEKPPEEAKVKTGDIEEPRLTKGERETERAHLLASYRALEADVVDE